MARRKTRYSPSLNINPVNPILGQMPPTAPQIGPISHTQGAPPPTMSNPFGNMTQPFIVPYGTKAELDWQKKLRENRAKLRKSAFRRRSSSSRRKPKTALSIVKTL